MEEIPFDRTEGMEPQDYADVAEDLYNRIHMTAKQAGRDTGKHHQRQKAVFSVKSVHGQARTIAAGPVAVVVAAPP